jgi:O-antigen ligase
MTRFETIRGRVTWYLWLALVLSLPITSFPFFAKILHSSSVAPASGLFLLGLAFLWLPFFVYRKGGMGFQFKPFFIFFLVALLSILAAFFRFLPDYKEQSLLLPAVEGAATLGLGFLFYFTSSGFVDSSEKMQKTLEAINWGGAILLLWSLTQVLVSFAINDFTDWMRLIQHLFSTTVLFDHRATGFASEPSWLAHQLNLVYIAYWLSATLIKTSVHRFRIWKLTFENILLFFGVIILFATFSRGGLAAFVLVLAFLFIRLNIYLGKKLIEKWKVKNRLIVSLLVAIGMGVLYLGIVLGGLFVLSKVDPRMEKVFDLSTTSANPLLKYAENLQFGERVVYWQTGWNIFNEHPILGVGVGYSGFYFQEQLPDYAWKLTEVRGLVFRSPGLLNIKSLWSRVLAETGIVGFAFFITFLVTSLFTAIQLVKAQTELNKTIGWMGIFMLIAFIIEGFSVDSFALPYYWFTLGLIAAAWRLSIGRRIEDGRG